MGEEKLEKSLSQSAVNANSAIEQLENEMNAEIDAEIDEIKINLQNIDNGFKGFFKYKTKPFLIGFFFLLVTIRILGNIFAFCKNIYYVDYSYFSYSCKNIFWIVSPFVVFLISTNYKEWNYYMQKTIILWLSIINLLIEISKLFYLIDFGIFIPLIIKIPVVRGITSNMLFRLAQISLILPIGGLFIYLFTTMHEIITDRFTREAILSFKLSNVINRHHFNPYSYDISIIRIMATGALYWIQEKDRFLHTLVDGSTGAGKTSSYLLPMIVSDLDTKVRNEDTQKKKVFKALEKGKIFPKSTFTNEDFNINNFAAFDGYEKVLNGIRTKYRSCGMTIVAPDDSITDSVYEYCKKRKIRCNRIDPADNEDGTKKEGLRGFNPLYISPDIPPHKRHREIVNTAILFGDVMQTVAELGGKSEQYFASVNRSILTAFIILLELTFPELNNGQCPTPADVQDLINDFSRVKPYFSIMTENDDYCTRYGFVIDFIAYDILGAGAKNMKEQSRGLRIMINELLAKPELREILCSHDSIDLDELLANGEITVVNYALDMGERDAAAFGMFFALSFNAAVLRRPGTEDTRLPHFYTIDEFPVLVHKQHEKCFSLFRKYRVAMTVAIQTLDQMDRNETTKYLRGIITSCCAHTILYGRAGATEMETFSKLAGKEYRTAEERSVSQTSLTDSDPSFSYTTREKMQQENVLEEGDIRNRGFQEVTVFSVQNGTLIRPFHGRLGFLTEKQKSTVLRYNKDWESFYDHNLVMEIPATDPLENKVFFTSKGAVKENLFDKQASTIMHSEAKQVPKVLPQIPSAHADMDIDYDKDEISEEETISL